MPRERLAAAGSGWGRTCERPDPAAGGGDIGAVFSAVCAAERCAGVLGGRPQRARGQQPPGASRLRSPARQDPNLRRHGAGLHHRDRRRRLRVPTQLSDRRAVCPGHGLLHARAGVDRRRAQLRRRPVRPVGRVRTAGAHQPVRFRGDDGRRRVVDAQRRSGDRTRRFGRPARVGGGPRPPDRGDPGVVVHAVLRPQPAGRFDGQRGHPGEDPARRVTGQAAARQGPFASCLPRARRSRW